MSEKTINNGRTIITDNRTDAERDTHRFLVIATDRFLSGWGKARGGLSYAAWACDTEERARAVQDWAESRSDSARVRLVIELPGERYRPGKACAHCHIYVVHPGHPALASLERFQRICK